MEKILCNDKYKFLGPRRFGFLDSSTNWAFFGVFIRCSKTFEARRFGDIIDFFK